MDSWFVAAFRIQELVESARNNFGLRMRRATEEKVKML
jgi:hypothetical protein